MRLKFKNTAYGSRMVVLILDDTAGCIEGDTTEIEFDEFVVCNLLFKEHNRCRSGVRKAFEEAIRISHTIANEHGEPKAWMYLQRECARLNYPVTGSAMLLDLVRARKNGLPDTVSSRIEAILDGQSTD